MEKQKRNWKKIILGNSVIAIILLSVIGLFSLNYFYGIYITVGTSMNPAYYDGDIILCKKHFDDLKAGDIVAYSRTKCTDADNCITHRIVSFDQNNDWIFTKGDNNDNIDRPITRENIIGVCNEKPLFRRS